MKQRPYSDHNGTLQTPTKFSTSHYHVYLTCVQAESQTLFLDHFVPDDIITQEHLYSNSTLVLILDILIIMTILLRELNDLLLEAFVAGKTRISYIMTTSSDRCS